jgi:D-3-phosphoglycerate dehydrogenase / 2-oxoglutarate reductase
MKILITTSSFAELDSAPLEALKQTGFEVILNPFRRKLTEAEVLELIHEHKPVGILAGVEPLTANVLKQALNLRAIARAGIGIDSVDVEAAKSVFISVTNTPDAPTVAVAELTMGMIVSLLRMLHRSDASVRANRWSRPMGRLLYGKSVGIIGCGRIGLKLASYLQTFGCVVLGSDPVRSEFEGVSFMEPDELLATADIVTLHMPYSEQTHHFINSERISQMKPSAYLVNTARGGLIDENALLQALESGQLAGAALDCFEEEPYAGPLIKLSNVLLTAHLGSYAQEARMMMEMQAAQNLITQLRTAGVLS